jgi:hypothetical protein
MSTQESTKPPPSDAPSIRLFGSFADEVVGSMKAVSEIAEQGPVVLLLSLGTVLIVAAPAFRLIEYTVPSLGKAGLLETTEFIALVIAGALLVLIGSGMRFYQHKRSMDLTQIIEQSGVDIIKHTQDAVLAMAEKGQANADELLRRELTPNSPL